MGRARFGVLVTVAAAGVVALPAGAAPTRDVLIRPGVGIARSASA